MDTRKTILDAAARVFSQHGFRGATTRRIADEASVNEVTLFRYFGSKEALLQEAVQHFETSNTANVLPEQPVKPFEELGGWCARFMSQLALRGPMIRKCMGELEERPELAATAAEAPRRATKALCDYFDRLKSAGITSEKFDAQGAATMLIAALFHDSMGRPMMPDIYPEPEADAPYRYARLTLLSIGLKDDVAKNEKES